MGVLARFPSPGEVILESVEAAKKQDARTVASADKAARRREWFLA